MIRSGSRLLGFVAGPRRPPAACLPPSTRLRPNPSSHRLSSPFSSCHPTRTPKIRLAPSRYRAPPFSRSISSTALPADDPDPHIAQLAFSRRDLMRWWHKCARDTSLGDLKWEGRNHLQAPCTVIWANGKVETTDPLSKQEMIDTFGIQPRDLRSLDAHILDVRPSLLVCKRSIILCTPITRAIISHDRLVLVGSDPSNPLVTDDQAAEMAESVLSVMRYLDTVVTEADKNGSKRHFEFRALEALLLLTVRGFKLVATELQARVYSVIPALRFGVSPAELRNLLESKRIVEDCLFSGRALQSALTTVLSEDQDLVEMYLTDKAAGIVRPIEDHQNAELLLEYYERRLDETNESSVRLSSFLADLDSNLALTLASTRVRLQNLELQTAITTLALAAGTALAGFFGMNLISGFEESPYAFYYATGTGVLWMVAIMIIGYVRLFRARRSQLFLGSAMKEKKEIASSFKGRPPALAKEMEPEPKGRKAKKEIKEEKRGEEEEKKKDGSEI